MMIVTFCALLFGMVVISNYYKQGQYKKTIYSVAKVIAVMLVISAIAGLVLPDSVEMLKGLGDFLESYKVGTLNGS